MPSMVVGLFDQREQAMKAKDTLQARGIPPARMSVIDNAATTTGSRNRENQSWWDEIKESLGFGVAHEDVPYYDEGLRQGGTLLSVQADETKQDEVLDILAAHHAVDLDTRGQEWVNRGWKPDQAVAIPVVEEELKVGKRIVNRGGVRIYTTTRDMPVEAPVTLREEHIEVTRRPADRPAQQGDMAAADTGIELRETAEEPVVSKEAKVVEEVVVKKKATERDETVKDTVRRKDVDVKKT
jgi:uncharacterized protein (TIGR02271 family)